MTTLHPVAQVRGRVRAAVPIMTTRENVREQFGTRLTILTEPAAGFLDVTAFNGDLSPVEAAALEGADVECMIRISARSGSRGGAFLDAVLAELKVTRDAEVAPEPVAV